MKIAYVRRIKDGAILDIPFEHLEETLKRGGFVRMPTIVLNQGLPDERREILPVENSATREELVKNNEPFTCPLCPFVGKNDKSLRMHKTKAHL